MKHLRIIALFLVGMLSHAATAKKDSVYTHINSLLKTINTTKKQKATYYVTLTTKDNDSIKLRIDFRKLKANIPIYSSKNTHFDIKAFLSLNQEQVTQTNQKLKAFDDKVKEYGVASKQLRALEKQLAQLKAVDSSQLDTIAIADLQEKIQTKQEIKAQLQQSYESLFSAYETQRNRLLGNLQIDYRQRVRAAINEAYKKLKKRETKFQSFDDDALFYDIRINLLKVDATRAMKVNYRARGKNKNVTQDISAGKTYFISHFAEFGAYYEEEQVKAIFKAIKRQEAQRNPYLPYEPFALVTSDKEITQEYISRIVDYKNYKGKFKEEEEVEEVEEVEEEENFKTDTEWISQFNCAKIKEVVGVNCRCVPVGSRPGNNCCNQACRAILKNEGAELTGERIIIVETDKRNNCKTKSNLINFQKGITHLNTSLEKGLPVLVGVQKFRKEKGKWDFSCSSYPNNPKSANHYIVIVSKKGNQYRYFEVGVGTQNESKGTDENNIFFMINNTLESREKNNKKYRITDIRVNKIH